MKQRTPFNYSAVIVMLVLAFSAMNSIVATAQPSNRVGLVIAYGDGSVVTRCIAFDEAEISGYEVLRRAGLSVVTAFDSGLGAGVCKIEHQGCPRASCMTCDTPNYWSYWHLTGGAWVYSQLGASSYTVQNGEVEGWRWGTGDPPPVVPFDQICAPPATDTPTPTATPVPPTNTPVPPTETPLPTDTPGPTAVPEPEAWFRLDQNPISAGSCTTLRWDVSNAREAQLDGDEVSLSGSRQVCPDASTEYVLRVTSLDGDQEEVYGLTLGVSGSAPVASPTPQPSPVPASPSPITAVGAESASSTPSGTANTTSSPPTIEPSPKTDASPTPNDDASPSPTATAAMSAQTNGSPTPMRVAEAGASEERAGESPSTDAETQDAGEAESPSILLPVGYIAFSLIVGGLVGWLVYVLRFRGHSA